jgi:hypothetical protein
MIFWKSQLENGKALMSNPNTKLGDWLLGKVLKAKVRELAIYQQLAKAGFDSVEIKKLENDVFR